jgi:hypothetical protein
LVDVDLVVAGELGASRTDTSIGAIAGVAGEVGAPAAAVSAGAGGRATREGCDVAWVTVVDTV